MAEPQRKSPDPDEARNLADQALFSAWSAGDQQSGDRLVRKHYRSVRAYFWDRARGEHEDLAHETFARLLEKRMEYRGGSFRGFLFGIARLVLLEFYRKRHKRQQIDPAVESLPSLGSGRISTQLSRREDLRLLYDALTQLCLDDLDLLELYYFQRLTGPELAESFGVPLPTLRGRIAAARRRLAAAFAAVANQAHDKLITDQEIEAKMALLREELAKARKADSQDSAEKNSKKVPGQE